MSTKHEWTDKPPSEDGYYWIKKYYAATIEVAQMWGKEAALADIRRPPDGPRPAITRKWSIDQVIVGGETGPGARPMHPQWARDIRDQCQAAGVPFFFKGWGDWAPGELVEKNTNYKYISNGSIVFIPGNSSIGDHSFDDKPFCGKVRAWRIGKKRAGRMLDGRTWEEFPK